VVDGNLHLLIFDVDYVVQWRRYCDDFVTVLCMWVCGRVSGCVPVIGMT